MTIDKRDRQTHHVEVAALNGAHKFGRESLNCVSPGLVSRLSAPSVLPNLIFCKLGERNLGTGYVGDCSGTRKNADPRINPVVCARQLAQHASGIFVTGRLSENLVLKTDYRVGAENDVGRRSTDGSGLG